MTEAPETLRDDAWSRCVFGEWCRCEPVPEGTVIGGAEAAPCRERSGRVEVRPEIPFVVGSSMDSSSSVGVVAPLTDSMEAWCSRDLWNCVQRCVVSIVVNRLTRGKGLGGDVMECAAAADP